MNPNMRVEMPLETTNFSLFSAVYASLGYHSVDYPDDQD